LEKPISAECAAVHALSNNENQTTLSFQTAELSIIECDIFRIFHATSTFGNGKENGAFFIWFGVPDYWMDGAYYAPNQNILR
jgi:hypothetical protein